MRIPITLATGLALIAIAIGVTLTRSPARLAGANGATRENLLLETTTAVDVCQPNEVLPRDTSAVRLSMEAITGPKLTAEVLAGPRLVTDGELGSGWIGKVVTIPVRQTASTIRGATVCLAVAPQDETVSLIGEKTPQPLAALRDGTPLPGRMQIEYLRPGDRSWWSRIASVVQHMGQGRAWSGTWIGLLLALLMGAAATLAFRQMARDLR
ncbi:MAG: hypothetical protein ACHQE6_07315 [Solirubrobacterales bacterium]